MARMFLAALVAGAISNSPAWAADQIQFNRDDLKRHSDAVAEVVRRQIDEQPTDQDKTRIAMIGELLKRRPDIGGERSLEAIDRRSAIAGGLGNNLTLAIGLTSPERTAALHGKRALSSFRCWN
jgi:hypothetical protein